jgi:signal peptidase I
VANESGWNYAKLLNEQLKIKYPSFMLFRKSYKFGQYDYPGLSELKKTRGNRKKLTILLSLIIGIPIIALLLTSYTFRIYHVEGVSMYPTLRDNQRILINKWGKTSASLHGKKYIPKRFDIVVITPPDNKTQVIKRVIGLPGDRIIIAGGNVLLVNENHPGGYPVDQDTPAGVVDVGELTEGVADTTLGENEIYVLGDNREHSEDSRVFGPVSIDAVAGRY